MGFPLPWWIIMKMSKPGLCCDSCFHIIANHSPNAAKLWLDLCDLQILFDDVFGLPSKEIALKLRVLELLGFIVTSETLELTMIKVNGKKADHVGVYFCGGQCENL